MANELRMQLQAVPRPIRRKKPLLELLKLADIKLPKESTIAELLSALEKFLCDSESKSADSESKSADSESKSADSESKSADLEIDIPKPLLKWVGGKTQIIKIILDNTPHAINNYHEIFLGGGSVLLAVLASRRISGRVKAYDNNEALIGLYINVRDNVLELFESLSSIIKEYSECGSGIIMRKAKTIEEAMLNKENYYYWVRNLYNHLLPVEKVSVLGSAYFVFLNKTGFRGVHRVSPRGYNVPYGNYSNPEIANLEHMQKISNLIANVEFICTDFSNALAPEYFDRDDFVYLDPPYLPISEKSFVKYNNCGFDTANHHQLFAMVDALPCKFMMSNSMAPEILKKYEVVDIVCRRSINSKNPSAKTSEVIIKN